MKTKIMTRSLREYIVKLYDKGIRGAELAKKFGISECHVFRIIREEKGVNYNE